MATNNTEPSVSSSGSCVQANGALKSVLHERERQNQKWGVQNHDLATWHQILSEEVGEAAEADLKRRFEGEGVQIGQVRDEYVQAAAVALQIVEYIDRAYFPGDE